MAKLAGDVMLPAQNFSIDDDAYSDSVRDADKRQIADVRVIPTGPYLGQSAGSAGVLYMDRQINCGR